MELRKEQNEKIKYKKLFNDTVKDQMRIAEQF